MLADLNTKSHPAGRLTLLRTLSGIEGPVDGNVVKEVVIKAFKAVQPSTSAPRGSNDPAPQEDVSSTLTSTSSSQSTQEKPAATLRKLKKTRRRVERQVSRTQSDKCGYS